MTKLSNGEYMINDATLLDATGDVFVERNGERVQLTIGDPIFEADTIVTADDSTADIAFSDGSKARISPSTTLTLKDYDFGPGEDPSFILSLTEGAMRSVSGEIVKQNPEAFSIVTPSATVGIRGTEVLSVVNGAHETHAIVYVAEGNTVLVTRADGQTISLNKPLQLASIEAGDAGPLQMQTFSVDQMDSFLQAINPAMGHNIPESKEEQGDWKSLSKASSSDLAETTEGHISSVVILHSASEAQRAANIKTAISEHVSGDILIAEVATITANYEPLEDASLEGTILSNNIDSDSNYTDDNTDDNIDNNNISNSIGDNNTNNNIGGNTPPPVIPEVPPVAPAYEDITVLTSQIGSISYPSTGPRNYTITGNLNSAFNADANTVTNNNSTLYSDKIRLNGGVYNGSISGDVNISTANSVTFGNDEIHITTNVASGTTVTGDALTSSGANLIFGNDNITVTGQVDGTIRGDTGSATGSNWTFGNDTIVIGTLLTGGKIHGDGVPGSPGGNDHITAGNMSGGEIHGDGGVDTIIITGSMSGGNIWAGDDNDIVALNNLSTGTVYGDSGNDTINIANLSGGDVNGGAGIDTITVTTQTAGNINGGDNNDFININNFTGGSGEGGDGNDTITIENIGNSASIDGQRDNDTITIKSFENSTTPSGGASISGGSGNDTFNITVTDTAQDKNITLGDFNVTDDELNITNHSGGNFTVTTAGSDTVISFTNGGITSEIILENITGITNANLGAYNINII